jgi:hypothetical protein
MNEDGFLPITKNWSNKHEAIDHPIERRLGAAVVKPLAPCGTGLLFWRSSFVIIVYRSAT